MKKINKAVKRIRDSVLKMDQDIVTWPRRVYNCRWTIIPIFCILMVVALVAGAVIMKMWLPLGIFGGGTAIVIFCLVGMEKLDTGGSCSPDMWDLD